MWENLKRWWIQIPLDPIPKVFLTVFVLSVLVLMARRLIGW